MKRRITCFGILVAGLVLLVLLNIRIGSIEVSASEIINIMFGGAATSQNSTIILQIRLPRIVASLMLGGGLALAGYMLQTFFHNPIAGPFVLGISSGAKLIVALLMVCSIRFAFYVSSVHMIIAAFFGALLVTGFVLFVSAKVKNMAILIVCGVMVGYICSAVTELVISFADDSNIVNLHNWSMGSFSAISWSDVSVFAPIILLCLVLSALLTKNMEAYFFGEDYAKSLGVNVRFFRIALILVSSVLSATVTAFAGPISFVGIAVPHIARVLFKTDKPIVIVPASFLGGAIFCLFSDLLARCLFAPRELSISTVTAILGAPVVIVMLLKRKKN